MRVQSKIITIAAALALTATPVLAQVSIGGRIGGSLASLSGEAVPDEASSSIGFSIGAFADISVTDIVSIQPELLFAQKGSQNEIGDVTLSTTLNYLQVPVTAKISMPMSGSSVQPYLFAGPAVAFNLGCSFSLDGAPEGEEADECDSEQFESIDFSLLGGVGAGFDLGSGTASIDVRYDLGLTKVLVPADGAPDDAPNAKNRAFSVTLGYSIPLGM